MKMKKIISILLVVFMLFSVTGCGKKNKGGLTAPTNVSVTADGKVTWDDVKGATGYVVTVNGAEYTASGSPFTIPDTTTTAVITVKATNGTAVSPDSANCIFTGTGKKLQAPTGVTVSDNGLISWNTVEDATGYVVSINGTEYNTSGTTFSLESLYDDAKITVRATNGRTFSAPSATYTYKAKKLTVTISGKDMVPSGKSITLTATVQGAPTSAVKWSIVNGGEYATVSADGKLSAKEVTENRSVTVRATSVADGKTYADKKIAIRTKTQLTQDMLDVFNGLETIAFDGYITIDLYDIDNSSTKVESSYVIPNVKTAMNGTNWYAEYSVDANYGVQKNLYIKNNGGYACEIGVDFMNNEEYFPITESDGSKIAWEDSGYINNFKDLKLENFTFDESLWAWKWNGDISFVQKVVTSANPYDFVPTNLCLIVEDGEVMGITSVSENDYTLAYGYRAIQELTVLITYDKTKVDVPTITKFEYKEDVHAPLKEAIENMKTLNSYKVDFLLDDYNVMVGGETVTGFKETVTPDLCYFEAYEGADKTPTGDNYGYKKINDNLYNAFVKGDVDGFRATRAYETDFGEAKPGFGFVSEIFTGYALLETQAGSGVYDGRVYYVNEVMSPVASEFYYGLGNDVQLYGVFAQQGTVKGINGSQPFTPFLTVEQVNGKWYITGACFYYYLGYMYGVVFIEYSDFDAATISTSVTDKLSELAVRQTPVSYDEMEVIVSNDPTATADYNLNALEYFASVFKADEYKAAKAIEDETARKNAIDALKEEMKGKIPFFGNVLGDTFGLAMTQLYMPSGQNIAKFALQMYYDVPLDTNYTIESSVKKVCEYLESLGFVKDAYGSYYKDDIGIRPMDKDLDMMIYVWKV